MHDLDLILTLAGGFTAALILGYFTQRAGLSPIVGSRPADQLQPNQCAMKLFGKEPAESATLG